MKSEDAKIMIIGFSFYCLIAALIVLLFGGCATIEYGPVKVETFGTDVGIKSGTWTKITSNQAEVIQVEGYSRNEGKSTKSAMNLVGLIGGGLIGSIGGPATAVGGSLIGVGATEMLQRLIDNLKPNPAPAIVTPVTPTIVTPQTTSCGCDMSKAPVTPPYTDAGLRAAGNSEECPQTKAGAGVIRFKIDNGHGGLWAIGHLLDLGYDIDGKGNAKGKCFDSDGGRYHFIGWSQGGGSMVPYDTATWFSYHWVTHIWFQFRK